MYKILIIGHGEFPVGIHSALNMIAGENPSVSTLPLDDDGHDSFEKKLKNLLTKDDKLIIFADLTGGAPHQIAARIVFASKKNNTIIVSGAPLAFLVQLSLQLPSAREDAIKKTNDFLEQAKLFAKITMVK